VSLGPLARLVFVVTLASLGPASLAHAQGRGSPLGVGFQLGDPTGPTAKIWLDADDALQGTFGWRTSIRGPVYVDGHYYYEPRLSYAYLSLDWVHSSRKLVSRSRVVYVAGHIGVGGGIGQMPAGTYYDAFGHSYYVGDSTGVELRVPIGVDVVLMRAHFELYAEVVPTLRIVPEPYPNVLTTLGGRYYF